MTTYRAPRDGSHGGWTAISNAIAEDRRLTPDGLALVVYLLTKPDNWQPNPAHLRQRFGWGRDRWRRVLAEVEAAGYVTRHQVRADGRIKAIGYDIHEAPLIAPGAENPRLKTPAASKALKSKALDFKGLESKGLESKGLESKGLEYKALEIRPLSNKGFIIRSTTTGEGGGDAPEQAADPQQDDPRSAGSNDRAGAPASGPEPTPAPSHHPTTKTAASAPSRSHSTIPAGWAPDQAVLDQLAGLGIDRGYALDAVPEFVRYWTDAGSAAASWHAKYLRHIQRQWARDRQRHQVGRRGGGAPAGFIEKHTDPTWRNGL